MKVFLARGNYLPSRKYGTGPKKDAYKHTKKSTKETFTYLAFQKSCVLWSNYKNWFDGQRTGKEIHLLSRSISQTIEWYVSNPFHGWRDKMGA